jgi:hypothetical protein
MVRTAPSIFKKIPEQERSALLEAIKGRKYWKVSEDNRNYAYTVALSRARIASPAGYYVMTSAFGRIQVPVEVSKYCRRYRVLLVDLKNRLGICVLTWMAFERIMRTHSRLVEWTAVDGMLPAYINSQTLRTLEREAL